MLKSEWCYGRMNGKNQLLENLEKLHTTELGVGRIKKNLSLDTDEVVPNED